MRWAALKPQRKRIIIYRDGRVRTAKIIQVNTDRTLVRPDKKSPEEWVDNTDVYMLKFKERGNVAFDESGNRILTTSRAKKTPKGAILIYLKNGKELTGYELRIDGDEITYTQKKEKEERLNIIETNNNSDSNSITPGDFNNFSIGYVAAFDDFGHGCYSLGYDAFSEHGYGMSFQGNANYGIVDSKVASLNFFLGPAYGYVIHPNIMLFTSLGVIATASDKEKTKHSHDGREYKTTEQQITWGVALRPQLLFRAGVMFPRVGIDIGWHELSKKVSASLNICIGISI